MNLNQKKSCIFSASIDFHPEDYLDIFCKKINEDRYKIFLENITSGFAFLGIDTTYSFDVIDTTQSNQVREAIRRLHFTSTTVGSGEPVEPLCVFVKSFSKSNNAHPWGKIPIERYVMPKYQLIQNNNKNSLVVSCLGTNSDDKKIHFKTLSNHINKFIELAGSTSSAKHSPNKIVSEINIPNNKSYKKKFEIIMQEIDKGSTNKIVLSRMKELTMKSRINVVSQMRFLRKNYSSCLNFLLNYPDLGTFVGSTPETLIKYKNNLLQADALAGTGIKDGGSYHGSINEPVDSDKNNEEHRIVLDYIVKKLNPLCSSIRYSNRPSILRLKNVDHLLSKVEGVTKCPLHVLELVNTIHPTPATSGNPLDSSLEVISRVEDHCRGWYAGPIGWFDKNGWGEANVALRSCLIKNNKAFLFSGSGIVNKSEVIKEWEETELKFLPILNSLKAEGVYE